MGREIWTIGKILRWTQDFFAAKGIESPRLDAEVLLAHVLHKERIHLYVHFDEPLNEDELAGFRGLVKGRCSRLPVAYLTGYREFMGLKFKVNHHVLVPRPETEILVQAVADELRRLRGENLRGADIGTGTGAIAIALLHQNAALRMEAVDISADALSVAQANAAELGVAERVIFTAGNLLEPLHNAPYDFIVSNPPYIPTADINSLAPEVQREPRTALDGGADGLNFYRLLARDAPPLLTTGGFIAVEVGINQSAQVAELFKSNALINSTQIIPDMAGVERVIIAGR